MKGTLAIAMACAAGLSVVAQQPGAPGGPLGPRFFWEAQTPWGSQRADEIAGALKAMQAPVDLEAVRMTPFKIFDNVYYVGIKPVSAYLVTTNGGLVLIDTTLPDTADLVLDNIRNVGFDPAQIKYVLVTHSHPDHFGGAGRIKQVTGARVVSSAEDWASIEQQEIAAKQAGRNLGVPLTEDVVKGDGDTLTVGDAVFTFYFQPGHSPGALAEGFQVFDRGTAYRALSPGGLGMQFSQEWTEPFIKGLEHLKASGPWDTVLPDHPFMTIRPLEDMRRRLEARGTGPNAALAGSAAVNEWLDNILKVAYARREAEKTKPKE